MWDTSFFGALTPKFYVALTGTSSLISGLILIFEWWYFRKYGTSFIEQVSLAHLGPWFGGGGAAPSPSPAEGAGGEEQLVWRNPMALLRGAEYARLWTMARRAPLTYYDMNLTAQEHQASFGCVGDGPAEEALGRAWRSREPEARVAAAREALRHEPDCAAALLLLAEEDAPTVIEAERLMRRAWRAAEASLRGGAAGPARARDLAVLAHAKRRAAACLRRLGRLRDAARALRELARDAAAEHAREPLEALLEVLLEQRAHADALALLARGPLPAAPGAPAATALYSRALLLLAARAPDGPRALAAALAANAHAPRYLLELRALSLPPEHVVRGGRSEALAYAFCHLRHWRACPAARAQLQRLWGRQRAPPRVRADRELLPGGEGTGGAGARALLAMLALAGAGAALAARAAPRWAPRAAGLASRLWGAPPALAPDADA